MGRKEIGATTLWLLRHLHRGLFFSGKTAKTQPSALPYTPPDPHTNECGGVRYIHHPRRECGRGQNRGDHPAQSIVWAGVRKLPIHPALSKHP